MVTGSKSLYFLSSVPDDPSFFSGTHLSVLIDRDALGWAVTERRSGKVIEVGRFSRGAALDPESIEYRDTALHRRSYGSGSVAFRGCKSIIVPRALYLPEHQHDWTNYGWGADTESPLQNELRELDAVVLCAPDEADRKLADSIPAGKLFSNAALVIGAMLRHSRQIEQTVVYADISESFVDLYVRGTGGFLLHNTFDAASAEDVIYHTANALQQLKLDSDAVQLRLSGDVGVESELFKLYQSYFKNVSIHFGFGMPLVELQLSSLRKQEYMSLLNQYACVL